MKKKRIPLKPMSPSEVQTYAQICSLQRDNVNVPKGWIILNGPNEVVLSNQLPGAERTGKVTFSRAAFTRIAKWYLTPQRRTTRS